MTAADKPLADPPVLHTVAAGYGRMIAAGELSPAGAEVALARICLFHPAIGVEKMDAALTRSMDTALRVAYSDELQAAQDVRLGIQPLLKRKAPTAALKAEAYRLSAARILRPDCDAIIEQEIAAILEKTHA